MEKILLFFSIMLFISMISCGKNKNIIFSFSNVEKFNENFDISLYGFEECGCTFEKKNVVVDDLGLSLVVQNETSFKLPQYTGGCVISKESFGYGKYTVCMKNQIKPGTVSSFFIMNPWQEKDWNHQEVDIEFLGKDPSSVQITTHYFVQGNDRTHIFTYKLPFNSNDGFHEYSINWTANKVEWFVDNIKIHTETQDLPSDHKMHILMNHWLGNINNDGIIKWLGSVDLRKLPSTAIYKYIRFEPEI